MKEPKKYVLGYGTRPGDGRGIPQNYRNPCIMEIGEEVEREWQHDLIMRHNFNFFDCAASHYLDHPCCYSAVHDKRFTRNDNTRYDYAAAKGFYIEDPSDHTILGYPDSESDFSCFKGLFTDCDIRRALAHVMLICREHFKSLTFNGTRYERIHDIRLEHRLVTFQADRIDGKRVRKVKMAIPFPIYELSCFYYTVGESSEKHYVVFNGNDIKEIDPAKEMTAESIPLYLYYVKADSGRVVICERQDPGKGDGEDDWKDFSLAEYNSRANAAKEMMARKNREDQNDPAAKKYHVETFYADSVETRPDGIINDLYELEVEGSRKLTPLSAASELTPGLSRRDYEELGVDRGWLSRVTIDMFFGWVRNDDGLLKGIFFYMDGELSIRYAFKETSASEQAAYMARDMKKAIRGQDDSFRQLPTPAREADIRRDLNRLLNDPTPENGRRFSDRFERYAIPLDIPDPQIEQTVREQLYKEGMVPSKEVVDSVSEIYKILTDAKTASGDVRIPNLVILGAPGTGKSTLARSLADLFKIFGANGLQTKTPADLKGPYVGHTGAKVYDVLKEAYKNGSILFIDEARSLYDDNFGREAMTILLQVMSGDLKTIVRPAMEHEPAESFTFDRGAPPIWLGGYERELRAMLSDKPGLYRRMEILTIPAPTASQLYECLSRKADETLRRVFDKNRKIIENYFSWGANWEHAEYFGNFDGVTKLLDACRVHITDPDDDVRNRKVIEDVIDKKKSEITRQYQQALMSQKGRNGVSGGAGMFRFKVESDVETTFDDVMGSKSAVDSLREIVDMLCNRETYSEKGIFIPKGMLMFGPPGTGKTLMARATAGELQRKYRESDQKDLRVAFIPTASTELIDPSDEPKRVHELFAQAEDYDAAIIFIDEIDGIGCHRKSFNAQRNSLLQLMNEMDGFEERKNIFVIAATNAPELLDPALTREGRFDRHVTVLPPDRQGRIDILKLYLRKLSACELCDREKLAESIAVELSKKTVGFTPAKLKSLVNEAALLFERWERDRTGTPPYDRQGGTEEERFRKDLMEMVKRDSMGEVRTGGKKEDRFTVDKNEGRSATAIHEVGHALTGRLLGREISEITVIPRGMANGYVTRAPDTVGITKQKLRHEIMIALGGLAAEQIFYGDDFSAGASDDIRAATGLAYDMTAKYGMSDDIGPMALMSGDDGYLGEGGSFNCSDAFRERIDDAVRKLLNECLSTARDMLLANKAAIEKIAGEVFERETMDAETFNKVCEDNDI